MTLLKFVQSQKISLKEFCERHDFNYGTIRNVSAGLMRPSPDLALRIEEATHGKINRLELLYPKKQEGSRLSVGVGGR